MTAAYVPALSLLAALTFAFVACSEGAAEIEAPKAMAGGAGVSVGGGSGSGGVSQITNPSGGMSGSVSDSGGSLAGGGLSGSGGVSVSGSAGAGGSGGGARGLCDAGNCADFTGNFDGYLFEYPCAPGAGCKGEMCVMNALTLTRAFQIKGDVSKIYRVDFHVRGVTESKNYEGGMRRSAAPIDPGPAGGDLWYEGGTAPVSSYSSYELHVTPAVTGAPNDYYLNARDGTGEHDATTWALDYVASVKVHGGGTITFKTFDSNCTAITNCGPKGTSPCTPRTLDLSDAVPAPTATQPVLNANKTAVQWLHIDVTNVEAL